MLQLRSIKVHAANGQSVDCHCWDLSASADQHDAIELTLFADGYFEVVCSAGVPVKQVTAQGLQPLPRAYVTGPMSSPLRARFARGSRWLGLRFALADARLLGVDMMSVLQTQSDALLPVELESRKSTVIHDVCREMLRSPTMCTLQTQAQRVSEHCSTSDEQDISRAVQVVRLSAGRISASELAARVDVHPRRLRRMFHRMLGTNPKTYCSLLRFRSGMELIRTRSSESLATIALAAGYADQAHLTREFRRFARIGPAAYAQVASQVARHITFVK